MVLLGLLKAFTKRTSALTSKFKRKCKAEVKCMCNMYLSVYTFALQQTLSNCSAWKTRSYSTSKNDKLLFFEHKRADKFR